jgi:hypothetical protein
MHYRSWSLQYTRATIKNDKQGDDLQVLRFGGRWGKVSAPIGFHLPRVAGPERTARDAGGAMQSKSGIVVGEAGADRLRDLARRCRELAEMTAVPDVTRELLSIARSLDDEAGSQDQD